MADPGTASMLQRASQPLRRLPRAFAFAEILAAQGLIQLLAALGGLAIVRVLDPLQYAYYALAAAAVTGVTALSNSGIVDGMTAVGGRLVHEGADLGSLTATALRMRRRSAVTVALFVIPVLAGVLLHAGAGVSESAAVLLAASAASAAEVHFSIVMVAPWLRGQARAIQRAELAGTSLRLALVLTAAWLLPWAWVALLCAAAGMALQARLTDPGRRSDEPRIDPGFAREITRIVRRQWPNEVNALLQAQASLWILALCARPEDVAALGALGRVAIVFTVVLSTVHRALLPGYARARTRRELVRAYLWSVAAYLGLSLPLLAMLVLRPDWALWLLGRHYAGLQPEFRLVCAAAALGALATLSLWLNAIRGWILPPLFAIPFQSLCLALSLAWFGAGTLHGVVSAGLVVSTALTAVNLAYAWRRSCELPAKD